MEVMTFIISLAALFISGFSLCWIKFVRPTQDCLDAWIKAHGLVIDKLRWMQKGSTKTTGFFRLFKDRKGEWRFNLRSKNGKIIAVSEGYSSKRNVERAMEAVSRAFIGSQKIIWEDE